MKESLHLTQEQKLQQRLSAQQVLFVRMLEMTAPEIEDEVHRVVDDNPALIVADAQNDGDVDASDFNSPDISDSEFNETAEQLQRADYSDPDDVPYYRTHVSNTSPDDPTPRDIVNADTSESLLDSLMQQLGETDLNPADKEIAAYVIGNIDNDGYLRRSASDMAYDIAEYKGIDIPTEHIRMIIDVIRTMEPAGIGATDLQDCLLLQLNRRIESKPTTAVITAKSIIANHFQQFLKKHFDKIRKSLGISQEAMKSTLDVIRDLNPKPGGSLNIDPSDKLNQITPDFKVETDKENGSVTVTLLNRLPELSIEKSFIPTTDSISIPADNKRNRDAQTFIRRKYDDAREFISCLKRRAKTLYSVMDAIVRLQPEFFTTFDRASLRPMILKDVANITGLDLSVISRAAAGKYVFTQAGTFPLKMFFSESAPDNSGASVHKILDTLKDIIDNEDHSHPYSDDALAKMMNERGFELARRTITKYRERLRIPVARLRKG